MDIGKGIKSIRLKKGLKQQEFSTLIGVTGSYLCLLEKNKKSPSTKLLEKIAKTTGVSLPILFWFMVEEKDINILRINNYKLLKGTIDNLMSDLI